MLKKLENKLEEEKGNSYFYLDYLFVLYYKIRPRL